MREIYKRISELFKENRSCVLATIITQTGSSPRGPGTKMLMMEDCSITGTIGGGLLESRVIEGCKKVFETHLPSFIRHEMHGADLDANEMICGGRADIFIEFISPDDQTQVEIYREITDITKHGGSGLLATVVDPSRWGSSPIPKSFIKEGDEKTGYIPGIEKIETDLRTGMKGLIERWHPELFTCKDGEGNDLNVFVEPVVSEPVVYLFGGGHVSKQIGPIAHLVGFSVVVIDDRPEFSDHQDFPYAKQTITSSFDNVMEKLPVNESSYLIIVTRGHAHDKTVLAQALKTSAKYIGMIGSSRKRRIIYDNLLNEGFTQEQLDTVYSPIGLEINAETPEEIAVAIVGELIKVRAGGE
ncbi:MAG: XdhC family protein [Deltaproteobacteria bacterium]|nr:XdhC family protein [Deltaproteobacteria bacterium]